MTRKLWNMKADLKRMSNIQAKELGANSLVGAETRETLRENKVSNHHNQKPYKPIQEDEEIMLLHKREEIMSTQVSHQILECGNISDIWKDIYRRNFSEIEGRYYNFNFLMSENISDILKDIYRRNFSEIKLYFKNFFDYNEICNFKSIVLDIHDEVYNYLEIAEKKLHCKGTIKRKNHLYPLDVLLLFSDMEISEKKLKTASIATTLFYMLSHFTDDYIEDRSKIYSKFIEKNHNSPNLIRNVFEIFFLAFEEFAKANFSKKSARMLQEMFGYKFFEMILILNEMIERHKTLRSSNEEFSFLIQWKAYELSGLMYSFLSDIIYQTIDVCSSMEDYFELSEATKHLGCLCQLTDDLRDFEKDLQQNEINIFCSAIRDSLEVNREDHPRIIFHRFFEKEIHEILKRTEKLNLSIDREKLILLSSYPFFMNNPRIHFSNRW